MKYLWHAYEIVILKLEIMLVMSPRVKQVYWQE